jgi:hypothetical protein
MQQNRVADQGRIEECWVEDKCYRGADESPSSLGDRCVPEEIVPKRWIIPVKLPKLANSQTVRCRSLKLWPETHWDFLADAPNFS